MTEQRNEPISFASTIAQCLGSEPTLAPGATAPIPLVGGGPTEQASTAPAQSARYETMDVLGQGGMGRVLAARDSQFGRTVARKEMTVGHESPEFIRRFLLESIVTANLEQPGVVPAYERGVRDGAPLLWDAKDRGTAVERRDP